MAGDKFDKGLKLILLDKMTDNLMLTIILLLWTTKSITCSFRDGFTLIHFMSSEMTSKRFAYAILQLKLTESQCTEWCIVKLFTGTLDIPVVKYCKCIKKTNAITGGLFYFCASKRLSLKWEKIKLLFIHVHSSSL